MDDVFPAVGVLHGQIESCLVDAAGFHAPAFRRVSDRLLQFHELGEVVVVQRISLAHVSTGVQLVVPDFARGRSFLEEQHDGFYSGSLERAAGAVQNGVKVAAFQQQFSQAHGGVVGVRQERVLDHDPRPSASFQDLDEVLQKQERGFARADREVLLDLFAFLAAKRRIGDDDVVAVFLLNVGEVLGERVGVNDVRGFDAVQDHVHDRDDIGQRFLFLAVERAFLQCPILCRRAFGIGPLQVVKRFAKEACRTARGVADGFADLWVHDLNDGTNQRARGVVFAAVPPGVAHVFDLGFVQVGQFILFRLGLEAQFVDVVDDLPQVVAALDAVFDLAEDLANLVFDGVRPGGFLLEGVQVREQFLIDEGEQVVAAQGGVVVDLAVFALGRCPAFPPVWLVEDVGVFLAVQLGFGGFVAFEGVEVFQE